MGLPTMSTRPGSTRTALFTGLAAFALTLGVTAGAAAGAQPTEQATAAAVTTPAAVKKFKNCTALNKKYPGRVAKSSKVKNTKVVKGKKVAAKSKYRPKVHKKLYAKNKGLDRDKDGIACER